MKKHYLTQEGKNRLQAELESLKGPQRDELSQRLRSAIQMGDLSENADYAKAKEDQAFLEGRILELEYILRNVVIIQENGYKHDFVEIGATVTVQEDDLPEEIYFMVGSQEADPMNGRISNESPIGQALLGKKAGDIVTVKAPAGDLRLKILKVE